MIQTMFNWFNQLSQLAHNSCTILPSPWSDPLAPPWSRPMRWVGSEFHPIGWYDLVIQPYQFLGHEPMSDLVHLRWWQVGNFAKLESNLSWHVLQKHLTLYIWLFCTSTSTVWLFLMKLVVPEPHYDQYLGFSNWAFTKALKQLNDKMIQNDTMYHSCFHFTVIRNNYLPMIKIPQFFQLKNFPSSLRSWTTFQSWPTDQQHDPTAADEPRFPSTSVLHVLVYKLQMCFLFV